MKEQRKIQANEAIVAICFAYLFVSLLSSMTLTCGGLSTVDSLFEAISGITTTGLSLISDHESIPQSVLFTRAWLQWVGGLGILVFSMLLLIPEGETAITLSSVQSNLSQLSDRTRSYTRMVFSIYTLLTVLAIVVLWFFGLELFNAINYALATVSTGGFSPLSGSLWSLNFSAQLTITFFAFICSVSLPLYARLFRNEEMGNFEGAQLLFVLLACISVSSGITYLTGNMHEGFLIGFSAQTTTGFSSAPIQSLTNGSKLLLILSMIIGGGVGSTAGGFKVLRLLALFFFLKSYFVKKNQAAHAYANPKLLGMRFSDREIQSALVLICLFFMIVTISWVIFVVAGYPPIDALFEVASATGTVGLSSGITHVKLSTALKSVLCIDMLLGRLEILPWLVLLYPGTWFGQRLNS